VTRCGGTTQDGKLRPADQPNKLENRESKSKKLKKPNYNAHSAIDNPHRGSSDWLGHG